MYPIARKAGITAKPMGDEVVLFDSASGSVHHLNRVAEIVWRSCDGRTDADALARIVARMSNVADAGPAVELALEQLSARGLLTTNVERANATRRRDRRDALKLLAKAMAIPLVMTITASRAHAQFSSGEPCPITCTRTITTPSVSPGLPGTTTTETITVGGIVRGGGCVPFVPCPPGFTQG
jgi:PqqD family protein of HPr-rel-A system